MRVLFVMEHPGVGPLVPVLRLLHERGHTIHLAARRVKTGHSHEELQALADDCERMTYGRLPPAKASEWGRLARRLRLGIDYLRYLEPLYRDATKLRARAEAQAPGAIRLAAHAAELAGPGGVVALRRALQGVERCLPPPRRYEAYLVDQAPDLLLITPLVDLGSRQADWLRAARRLGIRTAYVVFSWDNLTNKGLLRDVPDRVLVWNDLQAREAEELHGIPRDRIRVTGAPVCDPWFEWEPSRSREEFCAEVGLRADQPIVLYVCSSPFVAPDEPSFVRGWVERLRAWGAPFAEAGFLIRPYPDTARRWLDARLDGPQVRVWPRFGEAPHDLRSRRNFFDSIFHAQAVVGINTTAQIESAIVGRPVHTVLAEEFRETQVGTLHFHHLRAEGFGLLVVGRDFAEHAAQLAASLRGEVDRERNERFLRRFVRPLGLERPARELVVEEVERLGLEPAPSPLRGPVLAPVVRAALAPIAARAGREAPRAPKPTRTPAAELRRRAERVWRTSAPVVAGPWLGDEVGELLYWIPFLRWLERASAGVRERLFVVCRPSTKVWYEGIGAAHAPAASAGEVSRVVRDVLKLDPGGYETIEPDGVEAARREIAAQDPARRIHHRLVELAPPPAPEPSFELPTSFVAVRLGEGHGDLAARLAEQFPLVEVGSLDRLAQAAVLARARGYVGVFGPEAVLAALHGAHAAVIDVPAASHRDLAMARRFLGRPPFGSVVALEPSPGSDAAVAVLRLLELERRAAARAG